MFGALGILIAFVTIVGGSLLTEQAVETLGIPQDAWTAVSLLRFPVVLVLVARRGRRPVPVRAERRDLVPLTASPAGSRSRSCGWWRRSAFGLYVANFANYSNTYGALGGVVVLMLWFYLTALLLLVAAELTALLAKDREPHKLEARARSASAGGTASPRKSARRLVPGRHGPGREPRTQATSPVRGRRPAQPTRPRRAVRAPNAPAHAPRHVARRDSRLRAGHRRGRRGHRGDRGPARPKRRPRSGRCLTSAASRRTARDED